jgi:hypothetical protein
MTDEDEFRSTIDREQVTQARRKPFPDLAKVRRVRVDDESPTPYQARERRDD